MSDTVVKGDKKSSRSLSNASAGTSGAKSRKLPTKAAGSKLIAKRPTAEKAPVLKAAKPKASATNSKATKAKQSAKSQNVKARAATTRNAQAKTRTTKAKPENRKAATASAQTNKSSDRTKNLTHHAVAPAPPRQPTRDEAAALQAFERAHKNFTRGDFAAAKEQFLQLIEHYAGVSEVAARARTYLAIIETRLRTEQALPRDADALYDRGVVELNRGEYVAAQEMFERALKREPDAAHIFYGLAAARARLGSLAPALESLERAFDLQPNLRMRAQHDADLAPLRNEPDFERLLFPASRS